MASREICRQGDSTRKYTVVLKDERDGNHAYMTDKDDVQIALKEKVLREKGETPEKIEEELKPFKEQVKKAYTKAYDAFIASGKKFKTPQEIEEWKKKREIPLPYELCPENTPEGYLAFDQVTLFPGIAQCGSSSVYADGKPVVTVGTQVTDIVQERYKLYKVVETKEATVPNPEWKRQMDKINEEKKKAETEKRKKEAEWRKQQAQAKSAANQRNKTLPGASKKTTQQPVQTTPVETPKMPEFPGYQGPKEPDIDKTVTVMKTTVKDRTERYVEMVYTDVTVKEGADTVLTQGKPTAGVGRMVQCFVATEDGNGEEYMAEANAPLDKGSKTVYVS